MIWREKADARRLWLEIRRGRDGRGTLPTVRSPESSRTLGTDCRIRERPAVYKVTGKVVIDARNLWPSWLGGGRSGDWSRFKIKSEEERNRGSVAAAERVSLPPRSPSEWGCLD